MPLYTAPRQFVQRLHDFDPLLRVRFSDSENRYRIERRVGLHGYAPSPAYGSPEDRKSAVEGYECVLRCRQNQLDDRVFFTLWHDDIWRLGGPDKYMDQLASEEADREAKRREQFLDRIETVTREAYRYMNTVRVVPESAAHTAPAGGMSIND